jgi:hypothetical protein
MRGVDEQRIAALSAAGHLGAVTAVVPLTGGANNRVFRVETATRPALLKAYFRHPDDPRDRLATEFAFARCAWDGGVRAIPQPLACDAEAGLGLFEFVAGRLLRPDEVDDWAVGQAIDFFRHLNRGRWRTEARVLPRASESCLSIAEHFALVQRRIDRLTGITLTSAIDEAALAFIGNDLKPNWEAVLAPARARANGLALAADQPLERGEWCLSPSDFGYHNAILADDGRLRFIDFEYAGWDDPSKLVCDFFCQPSLPAPADAYERFVRAVAGELPSSSLHLSRANLLLPVYRIKWCCIMLNEFLNVGSRRRAFSGSEAELEERKARQLEKAREALFDLRNPPILNRKVA